MSVKGLLESEKKAGGLQRRLESSFNKQLRELRQEIRKVEYLLGDKKAASMWANSPADPSRLQQLRSMLDETERLYLEAGNSRAAKIFKERMEKQLRRRLTNLKANELEVMMRAHAHRAVAEKEMLSKLTSVKREGAARELYMQSRTVGGFVSGIGRGFMQDLVTLETKAAGSKTIGEYMSNLYTQYEQGLKDVFVKGIIRGDSYEQMENNLMRVTDITKGKARLLVRTEANAIFNESVREVIDGNPLVKGYRFRAVLDRRTSKTCQNMDGKYIPKKDVKPGINFPPLHPNCRSTVTTVLVSENEKEDLVQRYTKNRENEWVPVPPGMTYPEFKRRMSEFAEARLAPRGVRYSSTLTRETFIRPDDPRITEVDGTKFVPNVPGSAALIENKLGPNVSAGAQAAYDEIIRKEPSLTDRMIKMADRKGVRLSGIEFSAKTGPSVAEKIERVKDKLSAGELMPSDEQIVREMGDLLRYTVVADHDDLVAVTESFVNEFSRSGYTVDEIDNKYLSDQGTYRGIHLGVFDKDGQRFEVQVHSEKSLEVKYRNRTLYKEARKPSTSPERRAELVREMAELVKSLPRPKDIEKLKSRKGGVR